MERGIKLASEGAIPVLMRVGTLTVWFSGVLEELVAQINTIYYFNFS